LLPDNNKTAVRKDTLTSSILITKISYFRML